MKILNNRISVIQQIYEAEVKGKPLTQAQIKKKKNKPPIKSTPVYAKENQEFRESRLKTFSEKSEEDLIKRLFENDKEEKVVVKKSKVEEYITTKGEWDVYKNDKILYFDPELSYELTGYRPITETESLDFDPSVFTRAGETYDEYGKYTEYASGSKAYADFWKEETRRCEEGYTVGKYTVTGDHYFFLNFYRMKVVSNKKAGSGRLESFPSFHAKQYEFFHYINMCEVVKKDACLLKARGLNYWSLI